MEANTEIWKPVKGYEGLYEVSNLARVRSLDRTVIAPNNYVICEKHHKGKILKQWKINGYYSVNLCVNDKRHPTSVHRIVAEAFLPNPQNYPVVNHKDEDKTNNMPDNLEWCTQKYNVRYGTGMRRRTLKIGKPFEQLSLDGKRIALFICLRDVEKVGYCARPIHKVLKNKQQTSYGCVWRYVNQ